MFERSIRSCFCAAVVCALISMSAVAGQPNTPPVAVPEEELAELPRAKLEEGIFAQSGAIKIAVKDVEKIINLALIAERKRNPRNTPAFDRLLKMRLQVTEVLMHNALLINYAKEKGLAATPQELETFMKAYRKVLEQQNTTYEQFLIDSGMSDEEFKALQTAKLPIERQASEAVTAKEIEDKFNELKDTTPLRSVAHILFKYKGGDGVPKDFKRTKEEARALAEKTLAEAKAGKDFAELARASDEESLRATGGALDYFALKGPTAMIEAFGEAAYKIEKVGDFSPVIETPYGFYIIKLTGKRDEQFRTEIRSYLSGQNYKKITEPLLEETMKKAVFSDTLTRPPKQ